jgi:hypothetical protein
LITHRDVAALYFQIHGLTSGLTSILFEVSSAFESEEGEYGQNEGSVEA